MLAVIRKELLAIVREGRFTILALALVATLMASFWTSLKDYQQQEQEKSQIAQTVRAQWDQQGDKNPHSGAHYGLYVFRPATPLTVIEPGITHNTGLSIYLEPHRRSQARNAEAADESIAARLGRMSPSFILHTLLPLLIIAFSFNAVTQEREHGTLRMLHSLGVSGSKLLWGKLLALLISFAVLLLPLMALGSWLLAAATPASTPVFMRGMLLASSYLLYYPLIACIAIAISARLRSSRSALFILIGLWLAFTLILPRAGAAVAPILTPLPSSSEFWNAIKHDYEKGLPGDGDLATRNKQHEEQLLREHGVQRLQDLPLGVNAARRLVRDAYANKVHERHFQALWDRYAEQQQIVLLASALSPVVAIQMISSAIAGTDLAHQRNFEELAESYRREVNTAIDQWDAHNTKGITSFDERYASNTLWQSIKPFSYQPPSLASALGHAWSGWLTLAVWLLCAILFLHRSARKLTP
ncbi:ABC-2 family transporter protein [compost metagenome]